LEFDAEKIIRFVADEVAYEAYAGALRGGKGTLWGLAGNSVDQALLLAELLTHALVPVRFAVGALDDQTAVQIVESMRLDEATARARAERVFLTLPARDSVPNLPSHLEPLIADRPQRSEQLLDMSRTQLAAGVQTILDALEDTGIVLPELTLELPEQERTTHVWVQYADGPEWIDVDPAIPGSVSGQRYGVLTETIDALPDALYHRLVIRVVGETVTGSQPVRQDLLTFEARSADLAGQSITFANGQPQDLQGLGTGIVGLLEGGIEYIPFLVVGDDYILGTGRVSLHTGGGALSALGEATSNEGETLGQWLEIDLQTPDKPPRRVVREIFDRVGEEARLAGGVDVAAVPSVELTTITGVGGEIHNEYLGALLLMSLAVEGGPVPLAYFQQDYDVVDLFADLSLVGHSCQFIRDTLAVDVAGPEGVRFYADEPNIVAFTASSAAEGDRAQTTSVAVDILHRSFKALPLSGMQPTSHPAVVAGVLSHVAERAIVRQGRDPISEDAGPEDVSVGRIFEEANRQGIGVRLVRHGGDGSEGLLVSTGAKVRIAQAVADGYVVIVPEREVTVDGQVIVGWWQVDPRTGDTVDLLDDGRGMAATERGVLNSITLRSAQAFRWVGCNTATILIGTYVVGAFGGAAADAATAARGVVESIRGSGFGGC